MSKKLRQGRMDRRSDQASGATAPGPGSTTGGANPGWEVVGGEALQQSENPTAREPREHAEGVQEVTRAPMETAVESINWDKAAKVADLSPLEEAQIQQIAQNAAKLNDVLTPVEDNIVIEPETGPTAEQIAAAEALLVRVGKVVSDPDAPVSASKDPIKLLDADEGPMTRTIIGDMEIISSRERIEYLDRQLNPPDVERINAGPAEKPPVAPAVAEKITAEQEAGRRALQQQQARAVSHPRLPKTPQELEMEKPPVTIFRGGEINKPQSHMLRTAVADKSDGY